MEASKISSRQNYQKKGGIFEFSVLQKACFRLSVCLGTVQYIALTDWTEPVGTRTFLFVNIYSITGLYA